MMKEGKKTLTMDDIAKELSVSKTTISRAISGKGRISEQTRKKVLSYIEAHEYRPNVMAKCLASKQTYNIAVVLPADYNLAEIPFFQSCLMGVCEVAASYDYDVVVTTVTEDNIDLLKRIIKNKKVDGVILTRSLVNDLSAQYLKEEGIPFVMVGSCSDSSIIQVDSRHLEGCKELVSILLMTGNSSLALLCGSLNHIVNQRRYQGFVKAFTEKKIQYEKELIFLDLNEKAFIDHTVDTIMMKRVDCIVCSDDIICSRVLCRLEQLKYSVPEDVKVASFYNSAYLENHNPPITALNINVKELGILAGKRLIELIETGQSEPVSLVDYEILLKNSTKWGGDKIR